MKRTIALLALLAILAGCGSDTVSTTSTVDADPPSLPERPELAVDQMVAALMLGDVAAVRTLTPDRQLAIIVSLEGGGTEELAAMLEKGVPDEVATMFWTSFVDGFPELVGKSIENMEFGTSVPQEIEGVEFMSFPVAFGSAPAGTEWFVRLTDHGWQIDLLATFAGPFAPALEALVARTSDPVVREALRAEAPSIEAAYRRQQELDGNDRLTDALEQLLEILQAG